MTRLKKAVLFFVFTSTGLFYFFLLTIAIEGRFYEIWPVLYSCLKLTFITNVIISLGLIYQNKKQKG
jgi:hypothetical protein